VFCFVFLFLPSFVQTSVTKRVYEDPLVCIVLLICLRVESASCVYTLLWLIFQYAVSKLLIILDTVDVTVGFVCFIKHTHQQVSCRLMHFEVTGGMCKKKKNVLKVFLVTITRK